MIKIAVEQPYEDVMTALQAKGYEAKMFNTDEDVKGYDIGVVRAINEGNTHEFDFPVVSMRGMSLEDAVDAVDQKARLMQ
ncbi:YkuS family protein [Sporosarcina thermotolerans]|uniref:YkuS family protein n=1 Tax=Sporosarcina thermotolerans TaxID=633404 RepID=A0AAW9A623_9BACL|nr:YkuS family protein [Sporosarcina thermotolerans]MDW0116672.1 YkuS family protein [Sporosarcina thermotolerans]WHT48869.1 YkuS family protein [Sporosarcina thermotolerans]